jgi:hypothetical protein
MFQANIVEKITTHIVCSIFFFLGGGGKNCAAYEIMFKNIIESQATDDNVIWHMH